jgi:uncharacterized membrane protein YeaQ/YmgE (transglycosylase-associated protein family)
VVVVVNNFGATGFPNRHFEVLQEKCDTGRGLMSFIWTIVIGFLAGVVAKFLMPGPNEPSGFILTTILGIVGAFVASYLCQALGFYGPGEGAGFIGAVIGAVIVLAVWAMIAKNRAV